MTLWRSLQQSKNQLDSTGMAPWLQLFLCGWIFGSIMRSVHQDLIGKEAYLQMVTAGWINSWITLPLAIAGLIGIASYVHRLKKHLEHSNDA